MAEKLCELKKKGGQSGRMSGVLPNPGDYATSNYYTKLVNTGNSTSVTNSSYPTLFWNVQGYKYIQDSGGLYSLKGYKSATDSWTQIISSNNPVTSKQDISDYDFIIAIPAATTTLSN